MNCFVIMPFATDFDDVYQVIKSTVENAATSTQGRCFRLDESRPAGRITDRLLVELRTATFCIADLTGNKPNVMWELGFAMALGKPTIIITQSVNTLPFDIKDMQSIEYNRSRLSATLGIPLKQSVLDTLGELGAKPKETCGSEAATIGTLLNEVAQLKSMVSEVVAWKTDEPKTPQSQHELQALAGHWFNTESRSNIYMRVVRGELIGPYCWGSNSDLTGVYFGWRRMGEYWFGRFQWISNPGISGFSFLRMKSLERMNGAWWYSEQEVHGTESPPRSAGEVSNWIKQNGTQTPAWVDAFFSDVEREGLASLLAKTQLNAGR